MKQISFFLAVLCLLLIVSANASAGKPGIQNNEKQPGTISGRITIQGKPAAGIELALQPTEGTQASTIIARCKTDEEGQYKFTDLTANSYWLQVQTDEYVNANGIDIGMEEEKAGRKILVPSGQTIANADLALALGGTISGRIRDVDGKPVANQHVSLKIVLERQTELEPMFYSKEKTDSNGLYTIKGIPPGRYAVSIGDNVAIATGQIEDEVGFGPDGRVQGNRYFDETFYPGVTERHKVTFLEVSLGKEIKNVDFKTIGRAKTAYSVSGQVIDSRTGAPVKNCKLWTGYKASDGYHSMGMRERADENGYFKIDGLLPGDFYVSAYLQEDEDSYSEVIPYKITNRNVSNLKVQIYPGMTISGKIIIGGKPNPSAIAKLSKLTLSTLSASEGINQANSQKKVTVHSDGSFKIGGLMQDKLKISLATHDDYEAFSIVQIENPNGHPVQKLESDDDDREFSYVLTLDKNLTDLRIFVHYKSHATLKGRVTVMGGNLPANMDLRIAFSSISGPGGMSGAMPINANGDFSGSYLEPGEYQVQMLINGERYGEPKTVKLPPDGETEVPFELDLQTLKKTK